MMIGARDFVTNVPVYVNAHRDACVDDVAQRRRNTYAARRHAQSTGSSSSGSMRVPQQPTTSASVCGPASQRCVCVAREKEGFGLTLTGEYPVVVKSVKPEGSAARAGLRQGDQIVNVNGIDVTNCNHRNVVHMIHSTQTVVLTVKVVGPSLNKNQSFDSCVEPVGQPQPLRKSRSGGSTPFLHQVGSLVQQPCRSESSLLSEADAHNHQQQQPDDAMYQIHCGEPLPAPPANPVKKVPSARQASQPGANKARTPLITSPKPVTHSWHGDTPQTKEKQAEIRRNKAHVVRQMIDEEKKNLLELEEELRQQQRHPSATGTDCLQQHIDRAQRRIANLEAQLIEVTSKADKDSPPSHIVPPPPPSSGFSPLPDSMRSPAKQADGGASSTTTDKVVAIVPRQQHPARLVSKSGTVTMAQQVDVAPMDDSDSESEHTVLPVGPLHTYIDREGDGAFSNLSELLPRPAHLAVFLHYQLSNSDAAPLLFYLISDVYQRAAVAQPRDCKRWIYEIHSTFLLPNAPLCVSSASNAVERLCSREVCDPIEHLLATNEDSPSASTVNCFVRARQSITDDINEQLADFRQKRALVRLPALIGQLHLQCSSNDQSVPTPRLGNIYGENQLDNLVVGDRLMECRVVDNLLMPHFETLYASALKEGESRSSQHVLNVDYDLLLSRVQAFASALATVMKQYFGVRSSPSSVAEKLMDRTPTFVSKEKSAFLKLKSKVASMKSISIKQHQFNIQTVTYPVYCFHCDEPIWGVQPEAYFCTNVASSQPSGGGAGWFNSRGSRNANRHSWHIDHNLVLNNGMARKYCEVVLHKQCVSQFDDHCTCSRAPPLKKHSPQESQLPTRYRRNQSIKHSRSAANVVDMQQSPRRRAMLSSRAEEEEHLEDEKLDRPAELRAQTMAVSFGGVSSVHPQPARDPSVSADSGYGGDSDRRVDVGRSQSMGARDDVIRRGNNDKKLRPYIGSQANNGRRAKSDADAHDKTLVNSAMEPSSSSSSLQSVGGGQQTLSTVVDIDSDLDVEHEVPQLDTVLDAQVIGHLKPKERRRQEILNELFHTERSHVRNLKVLWRVFYQPMQQQCAHTVDSAFVRLLFANLDEVLECHCRLASQMRSALECWQQQNTDSLYGDVGDLLLSFFDGESGQRFTEVVARFVEHQQQSLEDLRQRTSKDAAFGRFLQEAELNPLCRKLQLKDMIPFEMQRLTKYPLLLDTLAKHLEEPSEELDKVRRVIEHTKGILDHVDHVKHQAERNRKLFELKTLVDASNFDKENHPVTRQHRPFDVTKHVLLHDGYLSWKLNKNKSVDVHMVLFEELIVLFTRHSDGCKLLLKYHTKDNNKFCPVITIQGLKIADVPTNKKGFFIVRTAVMNPQIYELVAGSAQEKKAWVSAIEQQRRLLQDTAHGGSTPEDDSGSERQAQVSTHQALVNPSEISVAKPEILGKAQPPVSRMEHMARLDRQVMELLVEKQRVLADYVLDESYNTQPLHTNISTTNAHDARAEARGAQASELTDSLAAMDAVQLRSTACKREVILAAIVQANRLLEAINDGMKHAEELPSVPCARLTVIAAPLMKHLQHLLNAVQSAELEMRETKAQLGHFKTLYEQQHSAGSKSPPAVPPHASSSSSGNSAVPPPVPPRLAVAVTVEQHQQQQSPDTAAPPPLPKTLPPEDPELDRQRELSTGARYERSVSSPLQSASQLRPSELPMQARESIAGGTAQQQQQQHDTSPESPSQSDDAERKHRRLQKRQRNSAIVGPKQ